MNIRSLERKDYDRWLPLWQASCEQKIADDVTAETWQIDFTARLDGIDERERLSNLDVFGRQAFFDAAGTIQKKTVIPAPGEESDPPG
mgnify:CR=1 FL=1